MTSDHNRYQRRYFAGRSLPRMTADLAATPYVSRHVSTVMDRLGVGPGASVLDVGCGLGKYTVALAARGVAVEGLDLTPELVEQLRAGHPEIPAHVGDAAELPEALLGRFDAAIGFFFLHHVADLASVFAGVRRALVPGGRLAFLEPNPLFPGYYVQIAVTPGMTWRGERGILDMRPERIDAAARSCGLRLGGHTAFGAAPPVIANRPWGRRLERLVESIPGWKTVGAFRLFVLE